MTVVFSLKCDSSHLCLIGAIGMRYGDKCCHWIGFHDPVQVLKQTKILSGGKLAIKMILT